MDRPDRLSCLDGLRGLAAALIVLFHANGLSISWHEVLHVLWTPFRYGFIGVPMLLAVSGFGLAYSRIRRLRSGRPQPLPSYMAARWWRVGLPYYAAMAVYLSIPAVSLIVGGASSHADALTWRQVITHLTFTHGFWSDTIFAINTPFWTLSVILQFYLVFPILFAGMRRFGPWTILFASVVLSMLFSVWVRQKPGMGYLMVGFLLGPWCSFVGGMSVAFWYDRTANGPAPTSSTRLLLPLALALLTLAGIVRAVATGHVASILFDLGCVCLIAAGLRSTQEGGRFARLLSNRWLVGVGIYSYSLYLVHTLPLSVAWKVSRSFLPEGWLLVDLGVLLLATVGAFFVGWLFYLAVEAPLDRWAKGRSRPRPEPLPTEGAILDASAAARSPS